VLNRKLVKYVCGTPFKVWLRQLLEIIVDDSAAARDPGIMRQNFTPSVQRAYNITERFMLQYNKVLIYNNKQDYSGIFRETIFQLTVSKYAIGIEVCVVACEGISLK
jgi:hypothetical protein